MRFIILVILNLPIILLALFSIVTQFKMNKISKARFRHQLILWMTTLVVLIMSFPLYNLFSGKPLLDSTELSAFDIIQTTAIIALIYIINRQRQKIELIENRTKELHQELSIRLSQYNRD